MEKLQSELQAAHPTVKVLVKTADTSNEDAVKSLFEDLVKETIRVDVLIQAAGAINNAVSGTIEPSKWWNDFEANVKGPYLLAHHLIAAYGEENTTFIVLGSNAAAIIVPGMSSYNVSKLAVTRVLDFLQTGSCHNVSLSCTPR